MSDNIQSLDPPSQPQSAAQRYLALSKSYTNTPIPAFASGLAILSLLPASLRTPSVHPRPWAIFLLSPPLLVSGAMTSQGAKTDGAGMLGAWSTVYCIVERKGLKSAAGGWRGKAVWALCAANAGLGVGGFFGRDRSEEGGMGWAGDI